MNNRFDYPDSQMINKQKTSPETIYKENIKKYENGQLDQLLCHQCFAEAVSIYFDGPHLFRGEYWTRIYFYCTSCKHWERLTFPGIPPHFDTARDILEVEER